MASAALANPVEMLRTRPMRGVPMVIAVAIVWLAGAIYCSGYERLMSGLDNWPGSLWWSAAAVLPWLALFEWSKSRAGRRLTRAPAMLALFLLATAAVSLLLEFAVNAILGDGQTPFALALMRRLPAIGASLLLILWSRAGFRQDAPADESLVSIAPSIQWVAAADNYVELHCAGRMSMRRMTMRDAERALASRGFVRIHRRFLVNRASIAAREGANGRSFVRLSDGTRLPIGRAYAPNIPAGP